MGCPGLRVLPRIDHVRQSRTPTLAVENWVSCAANLGHPLLRWKTGCPTLPSCASVLRFRPALPCPALPSTGRSVVLRLRLAWRHQACAVVSRRSARVLRVRRRSAGSGRTLADTRVRGNLGHPLLRQKTGCPALRGVLRFVPAAVGLSAWLERAAKLEGFA